MTRFLNPYNFIRPLYKTDHIEQLEDKFKNSPESLTESEAKQLLLWRCPPPPHDRFTGLSGKITCRMVAQTPIFVSDSVMVNETPQGHKTFQFFNVDGKDAIPASSLRGSIRSVFESVTNSSWAVFSDQTMSYREVAGQANQLIPAYIKYSKKRNKWIATLLQGDGTHKFAKISFDLLKRKGLKHGQVCSATLEKIKTGYKVTNLYTGEPSGSDVVGIICATGQSIDNKKNERLFFNTQDSDSYILNDKVVARYNNLIQLTREYHADTVKDVRGNPKAQKEAALSRYHYADKKDEIREFIHTDNPLFNSEDLRFPVYVRFSEDGDRVAYLAPVSIPRVLETRNFYQILEDEGYAHLLPSSSYHELSPADRVFGWVYQEDNANNTETPNFSQRVAYRGRVRFSHATPLATPQTLSNLRLSILGAPKPTTTRFYVRPQDGIRKNVNDPRMGRERWQKYQDQDLRFGNAYNMLRGRKVYRHHRIFNRDEVASPVESNQNRTIVGAHAEDTEYSFTIHFENLQSVELGALLWTLQLNDGWQGYHRVGYGKPLGFGSATIQFENFEVFNSQKYRDDSVNLTIDTEVCIEEFKQSLAGLYGESFEQLENVRDLKALLSDPALDVIHYPRSSARKGADGDKSYEWFMDNKRGKNSNSPNIILPYAEDDTEGFPYMYWDRRNKEVVVDW